MGGCVRQGLEHFQAGLCVAFVFCGLFLPPSRVATAVENPSEFNDSDYLVSK